MEAESNLPGISAKMPRLHQEKSEKWTRRSAARLALLGHFALCSAWVPLGDLGYLGRLALKYGIDGLCYPVLLASTRVVMLKSEELLLSGFLRERFGKGFSGEHLAKRLRMVSETRKRRLGVFNEDFASSLSGREEGLWSLFGGLFASLLSTALEEARKQSES